MDAVDVDHYVVLGLPSGEEGAKLSDKEIGKAYRSKALELHPDKRLDYPDAKANFVRLKESYEILKDAKARKLFDDLMRVRREKFRLQSLQSAKRRKLMSELEERERSAAFAVEPQAERITRKFKEEVAKIRAMFCNKTAPSASPTHPNKEKKSRRSKGNTEEEGSISSADKEKMVKVSWEEFGTDDYSAQRLREIFGEFGKVEDVAILSSNDDKKKKCSALVVMASKDAAVAATSTVLGDLSNPLFVSLLYPAEASEFHPFSGVQRNVEPEEPPLSKFVGAGFQAFEDLVLGNMKKKKAAEEQSG
ncbi:OLC1v1017716C1 [Oldenlandia corymbosa var. corymbosa]|uniref:OLC1v1017716C1 n=1 Tax=Oldenlandia corymbosa var. corymbosa TaxID=529605 RepID=A0AAV1EA28_OLDCO|nr:OLC1v1017716C1 [Oldenlandia corymbosa var. corymbosa]